LYLKLKSGVAMKDFKDKVVVITGGATGIGFSFAKQFGGQGAKIVIAARRSERINESVKKLKAMGIEAKGTQCDVSIRAEVEALADFAWKEFGRVDVIVNNAGLGPSLTSVIDISEEQVKTLMDVNLSGVWNGVSVFGKRFRKQGTPCAIYNLGSENSLFDGVPSGGEYVVSKHAVLALTDVLRKEAPDFMDVGLICPGIVNSELVEGGITFGMDTDKFTSIAMEQIRAGKFFIVSHAYNMARIEERYNEVKEAYEKYAPRYEGDVEFDVITMMTPANLKKS
jgi:NAD(P)-dependent dehydrogenase (short-subunit alcohol dehydrogenase family)